LIKNISQGKKHLTVKDILRIDLKITCAMKFDLFHLYLTG